MIGPLDIFWTLLAAGIIFLGWFLLAWKERG